MGAIRGVVVGRSDIREPHTGGADQCSPPGGRPIRLAGRPTSRRAQARPRPGATPGSSGGSGRRCERRGASLQVLPRLVQPVQPVPHTSAAHSETHPRTARTTAQNGRTFIVRVAEDTMAPRVWVDDCIWVDPDEPVADGSLVAVRDPGRGGPRLVRHRGGPGRRDDDHGPKRNARHYRSGDPEAAGIVFHGLSPGGGVR